MALDKRRGRVLVKQPKSPDAEENASRSHPSASKRFSRVEQVQVRGANRRSATHLRQQSFSDASSDALPSPPSRRISRSG
ncbi:MAG: hypothetical protein NZ772_08445, partial [Cyanobacteria bacterium]|nr:hypothetical protein [Cyanobacteriota bacterium]MDW8201506.1 hypothetical protein [Cyanobacteriota bacterium SKYGB_h_bin112]